MCLIFQRSHPAPLSSQKCSPTPHINTQFGFFNSSPHLDQSSAAQRHRDPLLPRPLLIDSRLDHLNCRCELECEGEGIYWQDLLGQKDTTEANLDAEAIRSISMIIAKKTHSPLINPSSSCCRPS